MEDETTSTQLVNNTAWEEALRKLEQKKREHQKKILAEKKAEDQKLQEELRRKNISDLKRAFLRFAQQHFSVLENDVLSDLNKKELQETTKNLFAAGKKMSRRRIAWCLGISFFWPASVILSGLALGTVFTVIVPGILGFIASVYILCELQDRYSLGSQYCRAYRRCLQYGDPSVFVTDLRSVKNELAREEPIQHRLYT